MDGKSKRGGARRNAGRKKGIGLSYDIERHCRNFIIEMLKDDAFKKKAISQVSLMFEEEIKEKEDFLYIIENNGIYKIGYSSNWKERKKQYKLHLGNVNIIYLLKSFNCFDLENIIHDKYKLKRVSGEWFSLSKQDIIDIVSFCSVNLK